MKNFHLRNALAAALTGAALATIPAAGLARDSTSSALAPSPGVTPAAAAQRDIPTKHRTPITLYVEQPDGNTLRLVHLDGTGWRYAADSDVRGGRFASLFRKVAFKPDRVPATVPAAPEPLTVFIDGPSGYTFVWTADGNWKFVGTLSAKQP